MKKKSRLSDVYAKILKTIPAWNVQGHPAPTYTTSNTNPYAVLASSTVKVVKRGHSKPKVLKAPYGTDDATNSKASKRAAVNASVIGEGYGMPAKPEKPKKSKLFTPSAKDVALGKQIKALRGGLKTRKG
jgi:hypothetical protein